MTVQFHSVFDNFVELELRGLNLLNTKYKIW